MIKKNLKYSKNLLFKYASRTFIRGSGTVQSEIINKKKSYVPNFRIRTVFYTNLIENSLILLKRINNLEKKLKIN